MQVHATSATMLRRQAAAAGLPLREIRLPHPCPMKAYNRVMSDFVTECVREGIDHIAFGDLFLEDIRAYREQQLAGTGIEPVFPLWGKPTRALAEEMLAAGVKAYVSCVDLKKLPAHFAGREWTRELLGEYPPECDPCGENGEVHTVVVNGPMFTQSIPIRIGEIVQRDGFAYADVLPQEYPI
jgi:diphthamide synthase (EF-2-diphthine--ammonia ligase)